MALQKVKDSMRTTTGLDATKLTGNIDAARLTNVDLSTLEYNQAILAFKIASANQLAKFSMVDQVIDEYQDATGIDDGPSNNYLAGGATTAKYYEGATVLTPTVTGGTITTSGSYTIHTFTSGTVDYVSNATQLLDILVLAGGGGGATDEGSGGGGAGGFKYFSQKSVAAATTAVTVGAGGTVNGGDGANSSFGSLVSTGGGGAGPTSDSDGRTGGSGGGATRRGSHSGGAGIANQGNNGGDNAQASSPTSADSGGGGGGASGVGGNAVVSGKAGDGGAGYTEGSSTVYDWTLANGTTATFNVNATGYGYAGGGAGGSEVGAIGVATHAGGYETTVPLANRGGGGGGNHAAAPGGTAGATGVVVIRRLTSSTASGGNLTLQSQGTAADSVPTTADLVILIEDAIAGAGGVAAINTDIKAKVSRDGTDFGDTYVTLEDQGDWAGTTKRIFVARNIPLTVSHDSGQTMKYKIETFNQSAGVKGTRIHATSLAWA